MAKTNKNENPLRSLKALKDEIKWEDYSHKDLFIHYCDLIPHHENEKLTIENIKDDKLTKAAGVIYAFVIDGKIFKIGQSIGTFKSRLGSYNTGKQSYRSRGTNSGANFFILQSIFGMKTEKVEVYLIAPNHRKWEALGETGTEAFPSAKIWERIILAKFKEKYEKLPIGNTQK